MKNQLNMDVKITNATNNIAIDTVTLGYWYGSKFAVASEIVTIAMGVSRGADLMTVLRGRLAMREAHVAVYRTWERADATDVKRFANEGDVLISYVTAAHETGKYDAMVKWALETMKNGKRRES